MAFKNKIKSIIGATLPWLVHAIVHTKKTSRRVVKVVWGRGATMHGHYIDFNLFYFFLKRMRRGNIGIGIVHKP